MNLHDARVLLTGAAGGIGSAIAGELARAGAALVLTDVRPEPLDRVAAQLAAAACRAPAAVAADVTTDEGRRMLSVAAAEHGVNVLINAAGVNPFGLLETQTSAEIGKTMLINAIAPMLLSQSLLPLLRRNAPAHVVNLGSTFGSIGYPAFCAYSASKFAIRGFSEALRRELADSGVRVHYLAPRATRTALATDRIRAMNEELKVGMDSPETVARAVAQLLAGERGELLLGRPERLFAKLNALLPALVDRALRKQLPIIKRYAAPERPPAATATSTLSPNH